MNSFIVCTDSGCDLPLHVLEEHGVVPFRLQYEIDGVVLRRHACCTRTATDSMSRCANGRRAQNQPDQRAAVYRLLAAAA